MANTEDARKTLERLERIGFSDWFQNQIDTEKAATHQIARVVSVGKDSYILTQGREEVFAELSGNLLYAAASALELPTTGDWVYADFYDRDDRAIIQGLIPRKTLLKRKTVGKVIDFQLIAANLDTALIIQAVDNNLNLRRLERYLVMVKEGGIEPVILLGKCDLVSEERLQEIENQVLSIAPQTPVLAFSNVNGENIQTIKNTLISGKTYCLLGSSGVGKTSLLNSVFGSNEFATQSVREKDSKGRHTTSSRDLILLENRAILIDTPGMRELGHFAVETGLEETFSEIVELAERCKFRNCSHTGERGCAVRAAIDSGELSEQRYQNYLKIKKEAEFNEMSYSEKRKKEKHFGKMVKSIVKRKNRW